MALGRRTKVRSKRNTANTTHRPLTFALFCFVFLFPFRFAGGRRAHIDRHRVPLWRQIGKIHRCKSSSGSSCSSNSVYG